MASFEIITESLLAAIEAHPVLWDKSYSMHKDRNECKKAWNEVCLAMNSDFQNFEDSLKNDYWRAILKRWTNIRDAYLKSLRKEQYSQTPIKPYTYSENLKFLKNTFKLPSAEDSTLNSSLTNEHFNFVEVPAKNLSESDESDRENNSANTLK
ncbi:uncharacterized protein LOC113383139 [Ctenocephalides felis]|uniref:uncharacterized protein LOC113383139 n=1 Tax=Ctenocephalides felis TaxID=7515 RepID=UPI000E6E522C|nr:uncharacterized protein LOC113383139 [Ctenocephalides felis]